MTDRPVTAFGPDFPFAYDDWLRHPAGLGSIPSDRLGTKIAVIGAGAAGIIAGHELMKLGLHPELYRSGKFGGRLRSEIFEGTEDVVAELGGMRFPVSSSAFYHYVDLVGLESRPFPNPLTPAAGSTVIDLEGETHFARTLDDLPQLYHEVATAYRAALQEHADFTALQQAVRDRDVARLKALWDPLVAKWDERTFMISSFRPRRSRAWASAIARSLARSALAPAAGTATFRTRCWRSCG